MECLLTGPADVGERALAQSHQRFGKAKRPIHPCSQQGNDADTETDQSEFPCTRYFFMSRGRANKVTKNSCGADEDDRGNNKNDDAGVRDDFRTGLSPA